MNTTSKIIIFLTIVINVNAITLLIIDPGSKVQSIVMVILSGCIAMVGVMRQPIEVR